VTLPGQVEQPAGRADHEIRGGQGLDLRLIGAAPVDGDHPGTQARAGDPQVIGDLDGQFPGGHDDQGAGC